MANLTSTPKLPEQSFESSLERLEGIVEAMESDKMPLEELLVSYEEGIKLVKVCQEKLESAEKRIEIITRNATNKPIATEFEPGAAVGSPASAKQTGGSDDVSLF